MNIDSFLKIGHSHTMCQDYILSGTEPFPYIILSDGCSSADNSDIGARLLCHCALSYLTKNSNRLGEIGWYELGNTTINEAYHAIKLYFPTLSVECLDATLIIAFKINKEYVISMYGDGHVYWVDPSGQINYYKPSFMPNAPAYLRYSVKGYEQYRSNRIQLNLESNFGITMAADPFSQIEIIVPESQVQNLIIASDGIDSLMFKDEILYKTKYLDLLNSTKHSRSETPYTDSHLMPKEKELNFLDVFKEIMDFKSTKGPFLSRRMKKVLKEYQKQGFINDDDISIGCFHEDKL